MFFALQAQSQPCWETVLGGSGEGCGSCSKGCSRGVVGCEESFLDHAGISSYGGIAYCSSIAGSDKTLVELSQTGSGVEVEGYRGGCIRDPQERGGRCNSITPSLSSSSSALHR
jgi:hypothetical protein